MGHSSDSGNVMGAGDNGYFALESIRHGERQVNARRDCGPQPVTDQPRQFQNGTAFDSGAQVTFIGDTFLIESKYVGHRRPRIEQGNRRVIRFASREFIQRTNSKSFPLAIGCGHINVERGEPGEHGFHEGFMGTGTIDKRWQTRPIGFWFGCNRLNAGTAAAELFHLPPRRFMTRRPFSGKSGSVSSRAISIGPSFSTELAGTSSPAISTTGSLLSKRSSSLIVTSCTPGTACTVASRRLT